jgi:DNA-binding response OmpR family regulator
MRRILLVEDDQILSIALRKGLESEGYAVEIAADGAAGRRAATEKQFDIIILDVMLPKQSGFDVCERLRAAGNETPIIMLTARNMEVEKVQGLKLGADDYITKPFSLSELFARIEAVLRRAARPVAGHAVYRFDDMTIDFKKYEATKSGEPLDLSPREFRLLQFFVERRGEVVSRDQILNHVWSYNSFPSTRTVDQHVAKLRQKIECAPNNPRFLLTVHGIGYKFIGSIFLLVVLSMGAI